MQTYSSTFKYSQARKKSSLRLLLQERIGQRVADLDPSAPGDSIQAASQTQRALRAQSSLRTISPPSPGLALFLWMCQNRLWERFQKLPGRTESDKSATLGSLLTWLLQTKTEGGENAKG